MTRSGDPRGPQRLGLPAPPQPSHLGGLPGPAAEPQPPDWRTCPARPWPRSARQRPRRRASWSATSTPIHRAVAALGHAGPPPRPGHGTGPTAIDGTAGTWSDWVERWHATRRWRRSSRRLPKRPREDRTLAGCRTPQSDRAGALDPPDLRVLGRGGRPHDRRRLLQPLPARPRTRGRWRPAPPSRPPMSDRLAHDPERHPYSTTVTCTRPARRGVPSP